MASAAIPQKILKIRKGEELKVYVSQDLCEETSIMCGIYRQTLRAVAGIVERTQEFHQHRKPSDRQLDEDLLSFGSNVIAFSAQRGCGKTSTMLSVSWMLEGLNRKTLNDDNHQFLSDKDREALSSAHFHVLSPISPSVLEEQQNILYVVLARLYDYALDLIRDHDCGKNSMIYSSRDSASQLDRLRTELQSCYDGILGVKQKTDDMPRDILELQEICDGLSLCRRFYYLVKRITSYLGNENHYLVLQLDDADSQVQNSFGVLEDVRKYLQIPNLIVLMSADVELIQDLVRQDFEKYFPGRRDDDAFRKRLMRTCRKYIDKLIPPTHLMNLPQLDASIDQYSDQLHLQYLDAENRLVFPWSEDHPLQDMLLLLIYIKTGVIFVKPDSNVHSIIPTTLRGLRQIIKMLSDMEDIPQIQNPAVFSTRNRLAEVLQRQIAIQETNLSQFADYFCNDWIYVKVTIQQDRDFLTMLRDANGELYVPLTIDYLCNRYSLEKPRAVNSVSLDSIMYSLQKQRTSQEDGYLLFSIRTLFTLKHHKMALAQKHGAINDFQHNEDLPFAVDYDPYKLHLSRSYLVNDAIRSVSLGYSRSISFADAQFVEQSVHKQELREKEQAAASKLEEAERKQNALQERLEDAQSILEGAKWEIKRALDELDFAQSELNILLSDHLDNRSTASERTMLRNAKIAVERVQITRTHAEERALEQQDLIRNLNAQLKVAKEDYKVRLKAHEEIHSAYEAADDGKSAHDEALRIYQGEPNFIEIPSTKIHPEFVIRNALYHEWAFQREYDLNNLPVGKFIRKRFLYSCMISENQDGHSSVNFLNFIIFLLRLGETEFRKFKYSELQNETHQMLYYVQECALSIALNWEVQDLIYRKLRADTSMYTDAFDRMTDISRHIYLEEDHVWLDSLYRKVDDILTKELNGGLIFEYLSKKSSVTLQSGDRPGETCWSLFTGYELITKDPAFSALLDFEEALYEIFDLYFEDRKQISAGTDAQPRDTASRKSNAAIPEDLADE